MLYCVWFIDVLYCVLVLFGLWPQDWNKGLLTYSSYPLKALVLTGHFAAPITWPVYKPNLPNKLPGWLQPTYKQTSNIHKTTRSWWDVLYYCWVHHRSELRDPPKQQSLDKKVYEINTLQVTYKYIIRWTKSSSVTVCPTIHDT